LQLLAAYLDQQLACAVLVQQLQQQQLLLLWGLLWLLPGLQVLRLLAAAPYQRQQLLCAQQLL
jgi:hypothetical protein